MSAKGAALFDAAKLFVRSRGGGIRSVFSWGRRLLRGQTFCLAERAPLLYYRPFSLGAQEKTAIFSKVFIMSQCYVIYIMLTYRTRNVETQNMGENKACGLKILRPQVKGHFSDFFRKALTPLPCPPERLSWQWRTPAACAAYRIQSGWAFLCLR